MSAVAALDSDDIDPAGTAALVELPDYAAPAGAVVDMIRTSDNVALRCVRWPSLARQPRGTVCLFQGRAEFVEKYYEVVRDLRARGFAVATFDWRGQGRSQRAVADGRIGHVEDFAEYGRDLDAFMRQVALPDCPAPFYALAHSMGAAVLFGALADRGTWFERMVGAAPMIGLPYHIPAPRLVGLGLAAIGMGRRIVPGWPIEPLPLKPFEGNPVTSDPVRYARTAALVKAGPELGIGGPSVNWSRAALAQIHRLAAHDFPARWRLPTLMLLAGNDKVVWTLAAERFCGPLRGSRALIIAGARHELMHEADMYRDRFWAAFDAFIPGTLAY